MGGMGRNAEKATLRGPDAKDKCKVETGAAKEPRTVLPLSEALPQVTSNTTLPPGKVQGCNKKPRVGPRRARAGRGTRAHPHGGEAGDPGEAAHARPRDLGPEAPSRPRPGQPGVSTPQVRVRARRPGPRALLRRREAPLPGPPPPAPRPGRPHAQLTEPPAGPCARGRVREGQTGGGQRSPTDAASRGSRGGGVPRDPGGRGGEGAGRRAREPRPETESDGETESEAPARAEREAAGRPAETRQDRGGRRGDAGAEVCGPSGDRPRPRAAAARGGGAPGPPRPQLRRVAAKAGGGRAAAQSSAPPLPPPHLHLRRPTRARGPGGRGAGVAGAHPQPGTRCGTLRPPAAPRPRRPRGRRGARGRRRPAVVAAGPARTERRSARLQPSARPGAAPPRSPRSPAAAPPYTCPRAQRAASGLGPRRRAALIARRPHAAPPAADQAQEAAGPRHLVTPPRVPPAGRRAEAGRQGRGGGRSSEPLRGAGRGVRGAGSLRGAPRGQGPGRALAPHGCVLTRRRPHGDEDEDGRRTRPCAPQCFREKDGNGPARGGRSWPGAAGAQRSLLPPRRGRLPPGRRATSPALCFALEPPLPPVASVFVPARVEQGSFPAAPVQCPCAASAASSQFIWQNEGKL
ncbi:translation initiation factor IF-2-like isoform X1 [Canis lupus familiaris]|uniref:translation initiation factor IF-2-like isoform X1 n=1 Tax=Canis lupus familiaris TaxID=9615 RepID=UPI0018F7E398|nr:translation initiation factor IF-2-like isoform X1 [Canis lupus familiaris]